MSAPLRVLAGCFLALWLVQPAAAQTQTKPSQTRPRARPTGHAGDRTATPAADAKEKEKEPPPGKGGLSTPRDDPFPSTYKAPAAPPFAIRNATILTAAGPVIRERHDPAARRQDRRGGRRPSTRRRTRWSSTARGKFVTPGIIDDHSHLGVYAAPGVERQPDGNEATKPEHRGRLGRALGLAAGSAVPARPRRRRHDDADPAGLGEPVRRPQRGAEGRAGAHRPGDEVPRRALRPEDGLRREPEARLRAARPVDAHGQRRRLSRGVDPGRAVPPQVGQVDTPTRQEGRARPIATSRSRRWPRCCAATSSCTTTATAPTRWRR